MGEMGHQDIFAPLAAAISPLAISPSTWMNEMSSADHNTWSSMPYSLRIVCGFFYVPLGCEHWRVVRQGLRFIVLIREDLKVLTICRCNYKGSTFSSVILRPWVLVQLESNSRPPAWQPDAQPTDPPEINDESKQKAKQGIFHHLQGLGSIIFSLAINRASHLCDPGSTMASGHMWAETQSISIGLRVFFSGFSGFLPSSKLTLSHLNPAAGGYPW